MRPNTYQAMIEPLGDEETPARKQHCKLYLLTIVFVEHGDAESTEDGNSDGGPLLISTCTRDLPDATFVEGKKSGGEPSCQLPEYTDILHRTTLPRNRVVEDCRRSFDDTLESAVVTCGDVDK